MNGIIKTLENLLAEISNPAVSRETLKLQILQLLEFAKQHTDESQPVEALVSNANGGQGFFSFMTAELINDEDLQYGNRVRKYWLITCEDWRDTEVEKKFILDARTFPKGTKITLEIPEAGLKQ